LSTVLHLLLIVMSYLQCATETVNVVWRTCLSVKVQRFCTRTEYQLYVKEYRYDSHS